MQEVGVNMNRCACRRVNTQCASLWFSRLRKVLSWTLANVLLERPWRLTKMPSICLRCLSVFQRHPRDNLVFGPKKSDGRSEKFWENPDLGSTGVWGAILMIFLRKTVTRKLRWIILLHLGRVTFRFHFGTNQNLYFLCFRIFGCVHDSQNQLFEVQIPAAPRRQPGIVLADFGLI